MTLDLVIQLLPAVTLVAICVWAVVVLNILRLWGGRLTDVEKRLSQAERKVQMAIESVLLVDDGYSLKTKKLRGYVGGREREECDADN